MKHPSPIRWLGLAVGSMIVALFVFNDNGPFPIFKPRMAEAYVAPPDLDSQILQRSAASLRRLWGKDTQAYENYRSGAATALRRRDAKVLSNNLADWDSSLRSIENDLQALNVSSTANGKLKVLLDESAEEFAGALALERRIAQSTLVMLSNKIDISGDIAGEMKEANMATVRSVLALRSAYQLLGIEPAQKY